jgi:hypothetical protein
MPGDLDLSETVEILERMVGSTVRIQVQALPDQRVAIFSTRAVLGPHRVGTDRDASGNESGFHSFELNPNEDGIPSIDGINLHARLFVGAFAGNNDEIVTIRLGVRTGEQLRPTVKLIVSRQGQPSSADSAGSGPNV